MRNDFANRVEDLCVELRAKAVLIALHWAGNADRLGRAAGMTRFAGHQWVRRGAIPAGAAVVLERIEGFPLSAADMAPGVDLGRYRQAVCAQCGKRLYPQGYKRGSLSMLKGHIKAPTKHNKTRTSSALRSDNTDNEDLV